MVQKKQSQKSSKVNVLALLTEDSAVGYYRIWQPLKTLERLGLINLKITPTFTWGKSKSEATSFPPLSWFSSDEGDGFIPDILVAQRHDAPQYISLLAGLQSGYQKMGLGFPIVVDTDDDVQAVRPFNPGYGSYNPDSDNVAFNIKLMSHPAVNAITVSTPQLKDRHEQYNKPVFVNPNSIDLKTRSFPRKVRKNGKIRIGWLGSACHWENLQIIQQAVKDIVANYPNVEFVFTNLYGDLWSNPPPEVANRVIPACNLMGCKERHAVCSKAYVTFDRYAKLINRLNLDIGLAPIYDNLFNRSKSNLRILEYWSDHAAVIASPVRPYRETVKDGKNGLLAQERIQWYNEMERLINDPKLLSKLQEEGFKTLSRDYDVEKNCLKLLNFYKKTINEYRKSH